MFARARLLLAYLLPTLMALAVLVPAAASAPASEGRKAIAAAQRQGMDYFRQGKYREATKEYEKAVALAERVFDPGDLELAGLLHDLGVLYGVLGKYTQAEAHLQRSMKMRIAKQGKEHPEVATSLKNIADLYREQGQFGRAESLYLRCLRVYEAKLAKDDPTTLICRNNLAVLYDIQGRYDQAEPLYRNCLRAEEKQKGPDAPALVVTLNNLAMLYYNQGQLARAELHYQRSLRIAEAKLGKDHPRYGMVLNNLAGLFKVQGRYTQAEPLLLRSLRICEERLGKDHADTALCLNNLAGLYRDQGRYAKAQSLNRRSLQIREARLGKDHPEVAESLNNLGWVYAAQRKFDLAEPLYRRSLAIWEGKGVKGHPRQVFTLNNLALLYGAQRQWDKAAQNAGEALRHLRLHTGHVLPALPEPQQLAFLRSNVGQVYHQLLSLGLAQASDSELAAASAEWVLNGKALTQEALAERSLLDRDSADQRLTQVVLELGTVRSRLARMTFASPPAGHTKEYFAQLGRLEEQAEELAGRLHRAGGSTWRSGRWLKLKEFRQALPLGGVFIEILKFDLHDIKAWGKEDPRRGSHYVAWLIPAAAQGKVQVIDLGKAQRLESLVAGVRRSLRDAPNTLQGSAEARAEKELAKPLQALAEAVLTPLWKHICAKECWLVSPDAALWLVPWAALPLPDGSYVIEKHAVSYLVSGRELFGSVKQRAPRAPVVLADPDFDLEQDKAAVLSKRLQAGKITTRGTPWASAALGTRRWPTLPGTAAEARAIAPLLKRFAGTAPRVYTGKEALEGVFKAVSRPRVVLLSTHGFFLADQDEAFVPLAGLDARGLKLVAMTSKPPARKGARPLENPLLRCGLVLAGANQRDRATEGADDGILTGLEILGCDLRGTELVVLSACETGLGQVRNGEGVAGLRQAFQLAGAQSVVATLWQIPDKETTQLMTAFFQNLAKKKGKAEALRRAQLKIIKDRRGKHKAAHPFYWAAFTLTGQEK